MPQWVTGAEPGGKVPGSEIKKGFLDFLLTPFLGTWEVPHVPQGAIWLCSSKPGAVPSSHVLSASGSGRVSHAANWLDVPSSHWSSCGCRRDWFFLGPQNLPALKFKGLGWKLRQCLNALVTQVALESLCYGCSLAQEGGRGESYLETRFGLVLGASSALGKLLLSPRAGF